jgi:hypothetical protein
MNLLKDIITYVRRIIKSPSNTVITDSLIIDYINRFWLMDVDARIQVFDLKTKYQLLTQPGVDQYNMPLYDTQTEVLSTTETQIVLTTEPFTDGTAVYFEDLLSVFRQSDPDITLKPGTVIVYINKGQADQSVYVDDSLGTMTLLSGTYTISSGTIDYNTADIVLNFTAVPAVGLPVLADFIYISNEFGESVSMFPVYQGFLGPAFISNTELTFHTERNYFDNIWTGYSTTPIQVGLGDGTVGPYTLSIPLISPTPPAVNFPISSALMRGHVDIAGIMATGLNNDPPIVTSTANFIETIPTTSVISEVFFTSQGTDGSNIIVQDSGEFLSGNTNYGLLMQPGKAPYGNRQLTNGPLPNYSTTQNTINYLTGVATNVYFPTAIPSGMPISAQCRYYQLGLPRSVLFYNNILKFRSPPNTQYVVDITAYLTPAAFFNTAQAIPYAYMAEYIARGAARKILSDIGDQEQFEFYEQFFKEQETLVHIRSQRQWTATRSQTIYSQGQRYGNGFNNTYGV